MECLGEDMVNYLSEEKQSVRDTDGASVIFETINIHSSPKCRWSNSVAFPSIGSLGVALVTNVNPYGFLN